jgi:hypothetical protein
MPSMSTSKRLAAFLEWKGWTRTEAAKHFGCSQPFVTFLLSGERTVHGLSIAHAIEAATAEWPEGPIRTEEWLPIVGEAPATGTEG